ncbi:MAG: DUF1385 domain-containing protein [Andreesenia angusta]|nr:DUF1385 domain-containing protein [Andreesenia angusta]
MEIKRRAKHMTSIGGQAIIEGVMMRGPENIGIAVRKSNGEIEKKVDIVDNFFSRSRFFKLPFIRGVKSLIESMVIGTKALMFSADLMEEEDLEDKDAPKEKSDIYIYLTVLFSLMASIVIFMIIPTAITSLFKKSIDNSILLNLVEGLIRVIIFLAYLIGISKIKDIRRTFEYHGAEHKTIHCYENREELTVENVKKYPILHPRCGTSFLFMVMIISIIVFSFFGWPNPIVRIITRILLFPVIGGISYEINKIIGRSDGAFARAVSYPGLMLQKYATTLEPDDEQIEVAIEALELVLVEDEDADKW